MALIDTSRTAVLVSLTVGFVLWGGTPAVASDGRAAPESVQTASEPPPKAVDRGNLLAEIGGGAGGFLLGATVTGLATFGISSAIVSHPEGNVEFNRIFANTLIAAAAGGTTVSGVGAGLAGNWTNGNGRVGFAVLGSTIGAVGTALVPLGIGAIVGSDRAIGIGGATGVILGIGGALTGGVLGYRWSARSTSGASAGAALRPYVAPTFDRPGGRAGLSIRF